MCHMCVSYVWEAIHRHEIIIYNFIIKHSKLKTNPQLINILPRHLYHYNITLPSSFVVDLSYGTKLFPLLKLCIMGSITGFWGFWTTFKWFWNPPWQQHSHLTQRALSLPTQCNIKEPHIGEYYINNAIQCAVRNCHCHCILSYLYLTT